MNKKYIFLTLLLCFFNIQSISAACSEEEINNFKKLEKKYTVKYEFDKSSKTYTMLFEIPEKEKYSYQIYSEKVLECSDLDNDTKQCINFPSGTYYIEIVGKTDTCDDVLKEIEIILPEYNKLSDDPLCEGIEEFVLCSPTYQKEIDYDTFVSRVETYKKTKAKKESETEKNKEPEEKDNKLTPVIKYVKDNLITLIIIVVFIILVIITAIITAKSIRKSRRLE